MGGYWSSVVPPYVKEFCTSEASCATNWNAAPMTKIAPKIAAPLTTIIGSISTFSGVHAMSSESSA